MKKLFLFISLFVLILGFQAFGYENSPIRISYIQGSAMVQRGFDMGFEDATINLPIVEGDRIVTEQGRVEVDLGNGNYFRLDQNTRVELDRMGDNVKIKLWSGSLYIDIYNFQGEGQLVVDFPQGEVVPLEKGTFRINYYNNNAEIIVREGVAEVFTDEGSRYVRRSQSIKVGNGRFISRASYLYNNYDDEFDKWNYYRANTINQWNSNNYGYEDSYLPQNLRRYSRDFDSNGRWIYVNNYGYCWRPISIVTSWRPYYNGRWTWVYPYGWTWVSYDPWWPTYHYGRWLWDTYYGWIWTPGSTWGPAWVDWFYYGDYYGWAPIDWYGRPVIVVNNRWVRHYSRIPVNARSVVVLRKSSLMARNVSRVAVNTGNLRATKLSKITLRRISSQPLAVQKISKVKAGNKILLKRSYSPIVRTNTSKITKTRGKIFEPAKRYRTITSVSNKSFNLKKNGTSSTLNSKIIKKTGTSSYSTVGSSYNKSKVIKKKSSYSTIGTKSNTKKITKKSSSTTGFTTNSSSNKKKIKKKKGGGNYPFQTTNNSYSNSSNNGYNPSSSFYRYYTPKKLKKDYYGGTPTGYYTSRKYKSYNSSSTSNYNKSNPNSGFYSYYKPRATIKKYSYGTNSNTYHSGNSYSNNFNSGNYNKYKRYYSSSSYNSGNYNSSYSNRTNNSSFWQRFIKKSSPSTSSYNYSKSYSSYPRTGYYKKYGYSKTGKSYYGSSSGSSNHLYRRSYSSSSGSHSSYSSSSSSHSSSSSSSSSSSGHTIKKRK